MICKEICVYGRLGRLEEMTEYIVTRKASFAMVKVGERRLDATEPAAARRIKYSLLFAYHMQVHSEAQYCHEQPLTTIACSICAGSYRLLFSDARANSMNVGCLLLSCGGLAIVTEGLREQSAGFTLPESLAWSSEKVWQTDGENTPIDKAVFLGRASCCRKG